MEASPPRVVAMRAALMSGPGGLGESAIGQVGLTVRDLKVAIRFYRDTLGLALASETADGAILLCGPTRLAIGLPTGRATQAGTSTLYFRVPDIAAAYDELRRRGVAFLTPPRVVAQRDGKDEWLAHFRDPDGNALGLMGEQSAGT